MQPNTPPRKVAGPISPINTPSPDGFKASPGSIKRGIDRCASPTPLFTGWASPGSPEEATPGSAKKPKYHSPPEPGTPTKDPVSRFLATSFLDLPGKSPFSVVQPLTGSKAPVSVLLNKRQYIEKVNKILDSRSIERNSTLFTLIKIAEGEHVWVFTVRPNLEAASSSSVESLLFPGVSNGDLLVKVYKSEKLGEAFPDLLKYPIEQYQKMVQDFAPLPEGSRPYAEILNADTARNDGYIVQRKVIPILEGPLKERKDFLPWNKGTELTALTSEQRQLLDQVKMLFHYSFLQHPAPGLDLLWQNLGRYPGEETLRIFDYREDDLEFSVLASGYLDKLGGSPSINAYILEGLQAACRDRGLRSDIYGDFQKVLNGEL